MVLQQDFTGAIFQYGRQLYSFITYFYFLYVYFFCNLFVKTDTICSLISQSWRYIATSNLRWCFLSFRP